MPRVHRLRALPESYRTKHGQEDSPDMQTYIIAVRRDARDRVSSVWPNQLKSIEGLTLLGASNPMRVQVLASPEAIERVRELYGDSCHIEPLIEHHTSRGNHPFTR